jgi:hypothetical protein
LTVGLPPVGVTMILRLTASRPRRFRAPRAARLIRIANATALRAA